jgi:hypothetical protein
MRHKTYRKWLHLNRPGELSGRQAKQLARHVRRCDACAKELLEIEKADRLIAMAAGSRPQPANPQLLTGRIMEAIQYPSEQPVIQKHAWLEKLYAPKVRFALTGAALVLLVLFIFQSFMVLQRISRLEEKMTVSGQVKTGRSPDTVLVKKATRSYLNRAMEQAGRMSDNLPDDRVIISKSTLNALLKLLRKRVPEDSNLIRRLQQELHLFNGINLEDGLEIKELKKILEHRKQILKSI